MNIRYPIYEGVYRILTNMECYFNSDYRETYAITPVTSMYLTPETDRLFRMDDYPERLSGWMERFTQCINRHFKVPVSL